MPTTVPWRLQADYIETCNCDFGCPCNFNGFPTGGRCEALVGYHLRSGRFAVPSILEASLTPHTDPVSGNEQEVEIHLPKGFIWKTAQAAKTAVMKILSPNMNFNHAGRNAFYSVVEYQGP